MKRKNNIIHRNNDANLSFENYFQLHKRYRYWLGLFYLVVALNILILQNYNAWKIVAKYNILKSNNAFIETLAKTDINLNDIIVNDLISWLFNYNIDPTPWQSVPEDYKKRLKEFASIQHGFLSEVDIFKLLDVHIDTLKIDTLNISPIYDKYDKLIKAIMNSNKSQSDKVESVKSVKNDFNMEVFKRLGENINIDEAKKLIFNKYKISNDDMGLTFSQFSINTKNDLKTCEGFISSDLITVPNYGVSLRGKTFIKISYLVMLALSIYLHLLYFTFKRYDIIYRRQRNKLKLVSSLPNMLLIQNIKYSLSKILLHPFFAYLFNVIPPPAIAVIFTYMYRNILPESFIFILFPAYLLIECALMFLMHKDK